MTVDTTTATAAAAGLALTLGWLYSYLNQSSDGVPVVPYKYPIIGSTFEYRKDPVAFIRKNDEVYGSIWKAYVFGRLHFVIGYEYIRDVFITNDCDFLAAVNDNTGTESIFQRLQKNKLPQRISMDRSNKIIREQITPMLKEFMPTVTQELWNAVEDEIGDCETPKRFEKPLLMVRRCVARSWATIFVGKDLCHDESVLNVFENSTTDLFSIQSGGGIIRWIPWLHYWYKRFKYRDIRPVTRHRDALIHALGPVIAARRKAAAELGDKYEKPRDILQFLLDSDLFPDADAEVIAGEILFLIFASVHTTSGNTTMLIYYLTVFPQYQQKLIEEQEQILAEEGDLRAVNSLRKMVYLDSFIREMFRYRGVHRLPHKALNDVVLANGVVVPKGYHILVNLQSIHRNEDYVGENPDDFYPWRYVGKAKSASKVGNDFLFFGMGKHACPGRFLAVTELKGLCTLLLHRYNIRAEDPSSVKDDVLTTSGFDVFPHRTMVFQNRVQN